MKVIRNWHIDNFLIFPPPKNSKNSQIFTRKKMAIFFVKKKSLLFDSQIPNFFLKEKY
jgi:hypothetical protein